MAERALPGIGLTGFWDLGANGWNTGMDTNLRLLSALVQPRALDHVGTTPGTPTNGDIYLFTAAHATQPNKIAIYDAGSWVYVTPATGWLVYDIALGDYRKFSGSAWVSAAGTGYTDEQVRDVMGAALVAGSNVTITVNDAGDTITIDATGGGGGSTPWDFSPPTASSFSLQSGDATNLTLSDDADVGLTIASGTPVNSDALRFAYRTLSTPSGDFDLKTKFLFDMGPNFAAGGLMLRDNTGGKNLTWQISADSVCQLDNAYGPSMTSFVSRANRVGSYGPKPDWLRVTKVGSNLNFYSSLNGKSWRLCATETVSNYLGTAPNRIGFFMRTGTKDMYATVPYFSLTGTAV